VVLKIQYFSVSAAFGADDDENYFAAIGLAF